ncbi:MAG: non-homologous end-joining DNA ligase [Acidimicrobiia bacterium]|nr:non-homologous end-joining DNA ligase [Acidimicrobiia bacterium]
MIKFGVSGLPPDDVSDENFLDDLVARGHSAYELAFVTEFPWKLKRCERFGQLAAERDIAISIHAPYFAVLTVEDEDKRKQCLASLEHSMKLGKALRSRVIVAHTGHVRDRSPEQLHELVAAGLETLAPKVEHLGVGLGLENSGTDRAFGTLGDIALIAKAFAFVRPVVDWAHVHAMAQGALTTADAFASIFTFIRQEFPGWAIDPLHTQFTDNEFGPRGEIRHVPYGQGTIKADQLGRAAAEAGIRMTVISEAHDAESHDLIFAALRKGADEAKPAVATHSRPLGSGAIEFPTPTRVTPDGEHFLPVDAGRPLRLSNIDKTFFPADGYTKGDLLQYYAAVAPLLLPHLEGRAIVMARYPDGAEGDFFYEKQAPSHTPDWLPRAPLHSTVRDENIEFVTAPDVESLLWIVNLGAIEIHPWLSRVTTPDKPDFAIFDLDPAEGASWSQVVDTAHHLQVVLDRLGLASYPKTSGATGLHVYVPIDPLYDYKRVRFFVETIGRMLAGADPDGVTMEWDIPRRHGKVFIDHNQNVGGKTIASVYSCRPRPGAPVSTPLLWDEVEDIQPDDFTIASVWDRLQRFGDLFARALEGGQQIESAEAALGITAETP